MSEPTEPLATGEQTAGQDTNAGPGANGAGGTDVADGASETASPGALAAEGDSMNFLGLSRDESVELLTGGRPVPALLPGLSEPCDVARGDRDGARVGFDLLGPEAGSGPGDEPEPAADGEREDDLPAVEPPPEAGP